MDLVLWRHADALIGGEGLPDLDRPLTPKGMRQAERMAKWLNQVLPDTARILCSPAVRTVQTAEALERRYKTVPGLAPDATVESLLNEVRWPEGREVTLVVGHQPTLGLTAAYLMGCTAADVNNPWRIKKGAVWWLRGKLQEDGTMQVNLVAVRSTDFL